MIVIDTNVVLDLFIFSDSATPPLREALNAGSLKWIATQPMRDELEHVLAYTHLQGRLVHYGLTAANVLALFDAQATLVEVAPKATVTCKDKDDQKFIDLAVAHQAMLLSKDKAVLCMRKRLLALGVIAQPAMQNIAVYA